MSKMSLIITLFITVCFVSGVGAEMKNDAASALTQAGIYDLKNGNVASAIHEFNKALMVNPYHHEARMYLNSLGADPVPSQAYAAQKALIEFEENMMAGPAVSLPTVRGYPYAAKDEFVDDDIAIVQKNKYILQKIDQLKRLQDHHDLMMDVIGNSDPVVGALNAHLGIALDDLYLQEQRLNSKDQQIAVLENELWQERQKIDQMREERKAFLEGLKEDVKHLKIPHY